jgi:outer membrane lipoprotein SlyB
MMIRKLCIAVLLAGGCYETSSRTTTWSQPASSSAPRYGQVESVSETVTTARGNQAAGAAAGALVGATVFRGGRGSTLFGAAGGAAVGSSLSSGGSQTRAFDVYVRFDDGETGKFTYLDHAPFGPGQRVALTSNGLYPG